MEENPDKANSKQKSDGKPHSEEIDELNKRIIALNKDK